MEVLLPDEIGMGFRKNITFVVKFKGAISFLLFFSRMTKISNFLYRDYSSFLAEHFDGKVQKLSVDGGFNCPNRDGTVGRGGCTYCNNLSFVPPYCHPGDSIRTQLELGKCFFGKKYPDMKYLAYFQSHTNTYAPLDRLRRLYEEALSVSDVLGLVISTRPDCLPDSLLDYLGELAQNYHVVVELGVESVDDRQLRQLNRGHTFQQAALAVNRLAEKGIFTAVHMILGLPGDTPQSLLTQPAILSALPIHILKLHQLQIVKQTPMAEQFRREPSAFGALFQSPEEYVSLLVDYLPRLRSDIVLERFTAQCPEDLLIAPRWGMKNHELVALLKKEMRRRGVFQGQLYEP